MFYNMLICRRSLHISDGLCSYVTPYTDGSCTMVCAPSGIVHMNVLIVYAFC